MYAIRSYYGHLADQSGVRGHRTRSAQYGFGECRPGPEGDRQERHEADDTIVRDAGVEQFREDESVHGQQQQRLQDLLHFGR